MDFFLHAKEKIPLISSQLQVRAELEVSQFSAPEKTCKFYYPRQDICLYCKDQVYASKSIVFIACNLYSFLTYANNSVIIRQRDGFGLPKSYLTHIVTLTKLSVN